MQERGGEPEGGSIDTPQWHIYRDRFVFDARTGRFFAVSPEGASILRDVAAGRTPDEIEKRLVSQYGIDRGSAMRDVEHFGARLRRLGIVRGGTAPDR